MTDSVLTDAEFVVLSMICEGPLHGYQIEQQIKSNIKRTWTDLSTSSIYYLLGKMEGKGWIEPYLTAAEYPPGKARKVYQATEEGVFIWKDATLSVLEQPKVTYTNFLIGLNNLLAVSPQEALEAVTAYRDWLDLDLEHQLENYRDQTDTSFPLNVLFEYGFVLGGAELAFLADLITRLEDRVSDS